MPIQLTIIDVSIEISDVVQYRFPICIQYETYWNWHVRWLDNDIETKDRMHFINLGKNYTNLFYYESILSYHIYRDFFFIIVESLNRNVLKYE